MKCFVIKMSMGQFWGALFMSTYLLSSYTILSFAKHWSISNNLLVSKLWETNKGKKNSKTSFHEVRKKIGFRYCYHSDIVISFQPTQRDYIKRLGLYITVKVTGYCYHLVDVFSLSLSQSDNIKRLWLYLYHCNSNWLLLPL